MDRRTSMHAGRQALALAVLSLSVSLAAVVALPAASASASSATDCKVRNVTRGGTYPRLGAAVKAARPRDKLTVRGTCTGMTRIRHKSLTIVGVRTRRSGVPTLRTSGWRRPLEVWGGRSTRVTLKRLTLRGAPDKVMSGPGGLEIDGGVVTLKHVTVTGFTSRAEGAGIHVHRGTLRLQGSTKVMGNDSRAWSGGGIYNGGTVVMTDTSQVKHNHSGKAGGGILNGGSLVLKRSSSIRANSASSSGSACAAGPVCGAGGGISSPAGSSVTMRDDSSVRWNSAGLDAGGIWTNGIVVLSDRSSIRDNEASRWGGGILVHGQLTMRDDALVTQNSAAAGGGVMAALDPSLVGVVCAPPVAGANVVDNTPDDCDAY